jgi:undecaprenyl phosphate-alpha-L-ara4N flippase subunit ArnE
MKNQILNYWLYLYLGCIYLVPLFYILRLNNSDTRFMLRKLFFPLEYIIQVKVEKGLSYSTATRLIHILVWCVSILGLVGASIPLVMLNEPLQKHTALLVFITYYCMVAPMAYWFQPHANISTKTK